MYSVINRKPAIRSDDSDATLDKLVGAITLENIGFAYPARPDVQIFRSFSLTVPAGKTVALVGSSGCVGKGLAGAWLRDGGVWEHYVVLVRAAV